MTPDRKGFPPGSIQRPNFSRNPYYRVRILGEAVSNVWGSLNRAAGWLAGVQARLPDMRNVRLGASYLAWGGALAGTVSVTSGYALEADDDRLMNMCFINCALAMTYLLVHPGTRGNSRVPEKEQKGLWQATYGFMWNKEMWTRVALCGVASFIASHHSTPKHQYDSMLKFYATGLNLLPFLTFRAGPTARVYFGDSARASRSGRALELLKAALANLVTTCINSTSSTLFTINVTILAKVFDDHFTTKVDPTGPTMSTTVAGICAHQVVVYITTHALTREADPRKPAWWSVIESNPLVQLLGLMSRAAVRVKVLDHMVPMDPLKKTYVVMFEIADLASRYLVAKPGNAMKVYEDGLMMKKDHAQALMGRRAAAREANRQTMMALSPLTVHAAGLGVPGMTALPQAYRGGEALEYKAGRNLPGRPRMQAPGRPPLPVTIHRFDPGAMRDHKHIAIDIDLEAAGGIETKAPRIQQDNELRAEMFMDFVPAGARNVREIAISETISLASRQSPLRWIRASTEPTSTSRSSSSQTTAPLSPGSGTPTPPSADLDDPATVNLWSPPRHGPKTD